MSEYPYPILLMAAFAESIDGLLASLYLQIRGVDPLNIICFYTLVVFLAYSLPPRKKKIQVIYVHKKIDTNAQQVIKDKVQTKMKEIKTFAEKFRAEHEGTKNHDFTKRLDQAILEIKTIQDLHNEFKQEIIDSHYQIIESLAPNKNPMVTRKELECSSAWDVKKFDNQSHEKKDEKNITEEIVKLEEYTPPPANHFEANPVVKENKLSVPEIHQSNPFGPPKKIPELKKLPLAINRVNNRGGLPANNPPKVFSENIVVKEHAEIPDYTNKTNESEEKISKEQEDVIEIPPSIPKAFVEKKETRDGNEILKTMNPVKLPPKVVIPRPAPIIAPRPPPLRGKGVRPMEDRSKYVPPPTVKSSPFG